MPKVRSFQTNFSAGFLDQLMFGRVDAQIYQRAAAQLDNWIILVQGGIRRRPGLEYIATLPADSRLESFVFDQNERYILCFNGSQITIYLQDGTLATTVVGAPWSGSDITELRMTQRGDTMIITHEDFKPQKLSRTSLTTFVLTDFQFEVDGDGKVYQPYYKFAASDLTLTPAATTGAGINVTASAAHFTASYVGEIIRLNAKQAEVVTFNSSTSIDVDIIEDFTNTDATADWDEPVYNDIRGYPRACVFHSNRLWFGGGGELPSHLFSSNASAFFKFDDGEALDGDSVQAPAGSERVNRIQHLASGRNLFVLSDLAELIIPESAGNPITPGSFQVSRQSGYGANDVRPQEFDQALVFVQDTGQAVREFVKNDFEEDYTVPAVSLTANSLVSNIRDMASIHGIEDGPEQFTVFVNEDGTCPIYHSVRAENIRSWSKWTTREGDRVRSVCTIGEFIFACVERSIDGATVYHLEKFVNDSMLDSRINKTSGSPVSTFSGLTEFTNETVSVVQNIAGNPNAYYLGDFDIDDLGNLDISPFEAEDIDIGFNFIPTLKLMPILFNVSDGFILSKPKRIVSTTVMFDSTLAAEIDGTTMLMRNVNDDLSLPPTPETGERKFYLLGVDKRQQLMLTCPDPLPCTILAIEQEVSFNG